MGMRLYQTLSLRRRLRLLSVVRPTAGGQFRGSHPLAPAGGETRGRCCHTDLLLRRWALERFTCRMGEGEATRTPTRRHRHRLLPVAPRRPQDCRPCPPVGQRPATTCTTPPRRAVPPPLPRLPPFLQAAALLLLLQNCCPLPPALPPRPRLLGGWPRPLPCSSNRHPLRPHYRHPQRLTLLLLPRLAGMWRQ